MPVLAVANQKGGVGKTTTVVNLGAALREKGYRVLLVDNDPQANLAIALGVSDPDALSPALGDLLMEHAHNRARYSAFDAIVETPSGLDLLPSNTRLSASELVLAGAIGRELVMRDILMPVVDSYDYVLIDCLPSLGLLTINALTAADAILIPVQADFLALQGVAQMLETVGAVRAKLNPSLFVVGTLLTMMDVRTAHARSVASLLREALAGQVRVFETEIRTQVALKDSVQEGRTILDFRADSQAAQAYRELANDLVEALSVYAAADVEPGLAPEPAYVAPTYASELLADRANEPPQLAALARPGQIEGEPAALARFGSFLNGREDWLGHQEAGR
jgi:chromosome partitioning protein